MKKIKDIILGLSYIWMPILGCYIAELIFKMIGVE